MPGIPSAVPVAVRCPVADPSGTLAVKLNVASIVRETQLPGPTKPGQACVVGCATNDRLPPLTCHAETAVPEMLMR